MLDRPYSVGDELTKLMPPGVMGKDIPLSGIFDPEHERYKEAAEFRARYESDPGAAEVVDQARKLEGLKRQWGVHAAGVIIGRYPLIDSIPIMRREADGAIITQFDYPTCETLGLLKMDFLGLRNLTVLDDALRNIVANGKEPVDLDEISKDLTDPATYDLLARGDTLGVFQFDGGPMRSLLRLMRPDNFEDISAVGALYRPGPMGANSHTNYALRKNGQQEITPIHPELAEPLEEILGQTYGLIVYQEQVMAIAQKVAGYSLGKADLLRRAMGKKKKSVLDAEYVGFEAGMKANGFSAAAVKTLWDILVPFADYAFNKAHSAAYGLISYWTAYLKANYPAEYMAGLLTSVQDDKDRRPVYLAECRRMGIKVLPPDVNESSWDFTAVGTDIRFGMASVRNVGHNVVDSIVRAREEKGAVQGLRRLHAQDRHGRLQQEGHRVPGQGRRVRLPRPLAAGHRRDPRPGRRLGHGAQAQGGRGAVRPVRQLRRRRRRRTVTRSAARWTSPIPTADWSKSERLVFERDMLGLYVSDHPLHGVEHVLTSHADTPLAEIIAGGVEDGANVTIAGILTAVGPRTNKQGAPWAIATLEDLEAGIEVLFFPKTWAEVSEKVVRDQIVVVKGRISRRDDQPVAVRLRGDHPRAHRGSARAGAGLHARRALHPAGGRAAARGAGQPPGHHRGAAQAGQRQPGDGAAAGPGAAGAPEHRADGRHQGAARPDQRRAALTGRPRGDPRHPARPHRNADEDGPVTDGRPPGLVPPPPAPDEPPAPPVRGAPAAWRPARTAGVPGLRGTRATCAAPCSRCSPSWSRAWRPAGCGLAGPAADYRVTAGGRDAGRGRPVRGAVHRRRRRSSC